ncbi:MAG: polymer-forming cytoskeletal protein [Bacteroidetes bacterium]|nr:polymer-forming cytoskeletal protein [Bacteroidota bacterium]MCZ6901020.1 polymer-forming cytoskeletal protein [Bacteroidota bacterium]
MFNNNDEKQVAEDISNSSNIIGKGTVLEGNIETYGNIRVEGKVRGNIKTKSKVALGQSSHVEGNVLSQNAEIAGEVKGRVEVSDLLILKPTAVIYGDIITNKLIVEQGASFNGGCKMGVSIKEIKIGEAETQTNGIKEEHQKISA